jgi:CRISPR-associated protein Cmr4
MTASLHRALLFLYAETPVHAGADTGLGALDLPIQREVSSKLPIIKGESLKGALRDHLRPPTLDEATWRKMFGSPPPRSGIAGGALSPGELRIHEAQLVAFPAPSLGGFAWVTSPLARARLGRRAALAGTGITSWADTGPDGGTAAEPDGEGDTHCLMTDTRTKGSKKPRAAATVLGSYAFTAQGDPGLKAWAADLASEGLPALAEHSYFRDKLARDLYEVSDAALTAITWECTAVASRVQLGAEDENGNPAKTVQHGPFYSEYLPAETVLAALLESADPEHLTTLAGRLSNKVIQVGGDETIGKGLMWCRIIPDTAASPAPPDAIADGPEDGAAGGAQG